MTLSMRSTSLYRSHSMPRKYDSSLKLNSSSDSRSILSREKVFKIGSELHRQTVKEAEKKFETQLAKKENELRLAINRRQRTPDINEKIKAKEDLEVLRSSLNKDYEQLIKIYINEHKDKVDQIEKYMSRCSRDELELHRVESQRKLQEALQDAEMQAEKTRLELINQINREQETVCKQKLAQQKETYDRLLDEQAKRLRAEFSLEFNEQQTKYEQKLLAMKRHDHEYTQQEIEQLKRNYDEKIKYLQEIPEQKNLDIAQLKGNLARIEYENRELKKLVYDLRSDFFQFVEQQKQSTYQSVLLLPSRNRYAIEETF
ncbi:unnamed protein product [Didymodactylos carnosus]|uniref:Uncharacterized protein n=1 Tax=Didymodactylos carnosus TaxID=1234261 RepID=A0A814BV69_9BILA|nr:unnamed protein product [Didymodactylos carnosus]CAF0931837.1 unnamed protein product [Didymodactylos carnosus]CAF3520603.1 unnamed protein product [Didymodactylos carnosus]CAF3709697.1 unnamed protein product [Didymodactylos carnosus]